MPKIAKSNPTEDIFTELSQQDFFTRKSFGDHCNSMPLGAWLGVLCGKYLLVKS